MGGGAVLENSKPWILLVSAGRALTTSPPLGLLCLAATLEPAGFRVVLAEPSVDGSDVEALLGSALTPPLLVGISARTSSFLDLVSIAEKVRRLAPEVPVVIGGVHVSALPEPSLLEAKADLAVRGEGDRTMVVIAEKLREGRPAETLLDVPGVFVRLNGSEVRGSDTADPPDLAALPPPAWHLVDLDRYSRIPWQLVRRGSCIAPIMTSRGCPFGCVFCASSVVCGRRLRLRDPEAVADEVEWLVRHRGVDEIHIADDNFNADESHAFAVCGALLRRNLRLPWKTPNGVRVDRLNADLLDIMKASGCYQLGFGIESGVPAILANSNKSLDLDDALRNIELTSKKGISTFGYFVVGLPGDTLQTVRESIRWALDSSLDHVHVAPMVPYPGSDVFRRMPNHHPLRRDWKRYTHLVTFDTPTMTAGEIRQAIREFYLRFYSRPSRAAGLVRSLRHASLPTFYVLARAYLYGS